MGIMKIPFFNRHETRAANTYTEAIIAQLLDSSNAETIPSGTTAAEEIVVGLFGRAFASATVTPGGPVADALTPRVLAMMGRDLAEYGESIWEIEVQGGALSLAHASDYTVEGLREWIYTVDLPYPDGVLSRSLPADRVVHLRYGESTSQPWKGIGPLRQASTTRRLTANLESRLADESSARSGYLLPVPAVSDSLQADLNKLKGKTVLVESMEDFTGQASKKVMEPVRLGFTPPESLELLRLGVNRSLLVAAGVPAAMLGGDANEMREGVPAIPPWHDSTREQVGTRGAARKAGQPDADPGVRRPHGLRYLGEGAGLRVAGHGRYGDRAGGGPERPIGGGMTTRAEYVLDRLLTRQTSIPGPEMVDPTYRFDSKQSGVTNVRAAGRWAIDGSALYVYDHDADGLALPVAGSIALDADSMVTITSGEYTFTTTLLVYNVGVNPFGQPLANTLRFELAMAPSIPGAFTISLPVAAEATVITGTQQVWCARLDFRGRDHVNIGAGSFFTLEDTRIIVRNDGSWANMDTFTLDGESYVVRGVAEVGGRGRHLELLARGG